MPLLKSTPEVLPAMEHALDHHCIVSHHKGDGGATLKANRSQSGQKIVPFCPALRESLQTLAERYDAADVTIRARLACASNDVRMQRIDLPLGEWSENDLQSARED